MVLNIPMGNEVSEEMANHQDAKSFQEFLKERKKKQSEQVERSEKYNFSPELVPVRFYYRNGGASW
jgi:hypothetical protein